MRWNFSDTLIRFRIGFASTASVCVFRLRPIHTMNLGDFINMDELLLRCFLELPDEWT